MHYTPVINHLVQNVQAIRSGYWSCNWTTHARHEIRFRRKLGLASFLAFVACSTEGLGFKFARVNYRLWDTIHYQTSTKP